MIRALVGYTGFVGSNLAASMEFDYKYNTENIEEAFGTRPDELYFAALRSEKFVANVYPHKDLEALEKAKEIIKNIAPKKLILISTIDVYKSPAGVDENSSIDTKNMLAYGKNRADMEEWVKKEFDDYLIVRLPAVYGINLRRNFIYDMINYYPEVLNASKYRELGQISPEIKDYYEENETGFYVCKKLTNEQRRILKAAFERTGFSALSFTDSRASYQFFNMSFAAGHIKTCLELGIKVVNFAVEPVSAGEVYKYIFGEEFSNEVLAIPPVQDFKTIYYDKLGSFGCDGYIVNKDIVLKEIKAFVLENIDMKYN